jgi:phosphopantothenoylcysteine decarboxylase/phosphopantothenate--cysteine ligase
MTSVTPNDPRTGTEGERPADAHSRLFGRRITLCVSGSIAAYKACELARLLVKLGAKVSVAMTRSATEFIGTATFSGITGLPTTVDMFAEASVGESHISLTTNSDLLVIAPATADLLARLASGRADDLVTACALCARCPIIVAPAMHPSMWEHPATQRNIAQLHADGRVKIVGPAHGEVASGDVGLGRLEQPESILHHIVAALSPQDLRTRHVVVSAGPTLEDLDPVRFLGNRSSGKMGFALAQCAAQRGARVTLVAGPTHLPSPPDVTRIDVRSALSMRTALWQALGSQLDSADILVMAAAVSDFRSSEVQTEKLRRNPNTKIPQLAMNPDILAEIGAERRGTNPLLIGFAVETNANALITSARGKLSSKHVDLVVANLAEQSFGLDENHLTLVTKAGETQLPVNSKSNLASQILDWAVAALGAQR